MIRITDAIVLQAREVKERFVRASGPGGQNLNKDATGVELRFDIWKSSLPADVKDRLLALGGRHVTTDGVLIVVGRASPSQAQNREAAHTRLVSLLTRAARVPGKRRATHPRKAAVERRRIAKERRSAVKQSRILAAVLRGDK
jgi:ribosome-associated protein